MGSPGLILVILVLTVLLLIVSLLGSTGSARAEPNEGGDGDGVWADRRREPSRTLSSGGDASPAVVAQEPLPKTADAGVMLHGATLNSTAVMFSAGYGAVAASPCEVASERWMSALPLLAGERLTVSSWQPHADTTGVALIVNGALEASSTSFPALFTFDVPADGKYTVGIITLPLIGPTGATIDVACLRRGTTAPE